MWQERKTAWSREGWLGSELRKLPVAVVVDRVAWVKPAKTAKLSVS